MLLILNLPLAPLWVRLLMIPRPWLYGGILVFALLGAYSVNGSIADLVILMLIGVLGYAMRVYDFPVAPVLVGMILGPLSEQQLRRALAISQGDPSVFLTRPIAAGILAIALAIVVVPPLLRLRRQPAS
jgi:putative tricarboxylic transport membrane protein